MNEARGAMTQPAAPTTPAPAAPPRKRSALEVLRGLREPKVLVMLGLGFASGLPFLLTANTFGYWLRDEGTSLKAIGFISWVGFAYAFKVYWSPLVDRLDVPLLGRLGRRRGWMLLSQLLVVAGLIGMASVGVSAGLGVIGAFALLTAFASATQDIAVDAWRIEAASHADEVGLLTSAAQLGYRVALLIADAAIIAAAQRIGWPLSYGAMAVLMGIGIVATFCLRAGACRRRAARQAAVAVAPRALDAVLAPSPTSSSARQRGPGDSCWRWPVPPARFHHGPMYNPFYHDMACPRTPWPWCAAPSA
jgi:PAT family beta-lactamase induction signal transducer AmpG